MSPRSCETFEWVVFYIEKCRQDIHAMPGEARLFSPLHHAKNVINQTTFVEIIWKVSLEQWKLTS